VTCIVALELGQLVVGSLQTLQLAVLCGNLGSLLVKISVLPLPQTLDLGKIRHGPTDECRSFITLSIRRSVQRDGRDTARRAVCSAAAETCFISTGRAPRDLSFSTRRLLRH